MTPYVGRFGDGVLLWFERSGLMLWIGLIGRDFRGAAFGATLGEYEHLLGLDHDIEAEAYAVFDTLLTPLGAIEMDKVRLATDFAEVIEYVSRYRANRIAMSERDRAPQPLPPVPVLGFDPLCQRDDECNRIAHRFVMRSDLGDTYVWHINLANATVVPPQPARLFRE